MLALGQLLELTLGGREPSAKIQLTPEGTRLRWLAEGALEITPAEGRDNGLDVLLSAGIHGNETAPIELLDRLVRAIASNQLQPHARLLILLGNPAAMRHGERYIEQDLNRLFNGRHEYSEGYEALRAGELERLAANFFHVPERERLHYDLHTAMRASKIEQFALYPWAEGRLHSKRELARLNAAGMEAALLQSKSSITFSAYTYSTLGAEAFTLELGKARPFGHNELVNLDLLEARLHSIIQGDEPEHDEQGLAGLQLFAVSREVIKRSDAFELHLPADIENFTELALGYVLADDQDGARWIIDEPGARIIFPNPKVKNGQRAGILIVPCDSAQLA